MEMTGESVASPLVTARDEVRRRGSKGEEEREQG